MTLKWPKVVPAELRTGWRLFLSFYWWLWGLTLSRATKRDLEALREVLDTPMRVMAWLWGNVEYTPDKTLEDQWQRAERTFERRKGDCEDWAIFANYCLRDRVEGYFICMYTKTTGHAEHLIADAVRVRTKASTGAYIPLEGEWTSVGTYGLNRHEGKLPDIVSDWSGFQDWTTAVLMDEGMMVLEVWYRQLPDET